MLAERGLHNLQTNSAGNNQLALPETYTILKLPPRAFLQFPRVTALIYSTTATCASQIKFLYSIVFQNIKMFARHRHTNRKPHLLAKNKYVKLKMQL